MEIKSPEMRSPALAEVEKFVTRIWEHPLVDQRTQEYREKGIPAIEGLMMRKGIKPEDFIAIPYGSVRWSVKSSKEGKGTKEPSDFDVFLIFRDEETESLAVRTYGGLLFRDCRFSFGGSRTLTEIETHKDLSPFMPGNVTQLEVNLLLTPDDYIAGNLELARQLRVNAVKYFKDNFYLEFFFEKDFKNWPDVPMHNLDDIGYVNLETKPSHWYRHRVKGRRERFFSRLSERSKASHDPEAYIKSFIKSYRAINPPNFSTFRDGILSSGGSLSIDSRYSAHGIGY